MTKTARNSNTYIFDVDVSKITLSEKVTKGEAVDENRQKVRFRNSFISYDNKPFTVKFYKKIDGTTEKTVLESMIFSFIATKRDGEAYDTYSAMIFVDDNEAIKEKMEEIHEKISALATVLAYAKKLGLNTMKVGKKKVFVGPSDLISLYERKTGDDDEDDDDSEGRSYFSAKFLKSFKNQTCIRVITGDGIKTLEHPSLKFARMKMIPELRFTSLFSGAQCRIKIELVSAVVTEFLESDFDEDDTADAQEDLLADLTTSTNTSSLTAMEKSLKDLERSSKHRESVSQTSDSDSDGDGDELGDAVDDILDS